MENTLLGMTESWAASYKDFESSGKLESPLTYIYKRVNKMWCKISILLINTDAFFAVLQRNDSWYA